MTEPGAADDGTGRAAGRDEMVDGQGGVRSHWRTLLSTFHGLGEGGLHDRAARLDRALEEEGLGAVLPGGGREISPWRCDPVPLLLQPAEFEALEAGLAQRARLISAVLDDLYGEQDLLRDDHLPAERVYASPGFLRACRVPSGQGKSGDAKSGDAKSGDARPGQDKAGRHLQLYAADLIRDENGAWRVLADRTSVVAGAGVARENRQILERVFPEAFRATQVRQQRSFFDRWRDSMAAADHPNASVALLTPGTADPHWLEHVVLARELSCTLVEGGDLAVRGGKLLLKTLTGLQPVDVLLRQVEGRLLDPLELEVAAWAGMPGLLDAARDGGVAILNGPGSGLGEIPLLPAFLPALCRHLLGEELALPGVPCRWLGDPAALQLVEAEPDAWLIRAASDPAVPPMAPARPAESAGQMMAGVRQRPWDFVAVRKLSPGTVPCVGSLGLEPRAVVMRLFLVFDGGVWRAMRGGLGRICSLEEGLAAFLPRGALTKDVWVLAEDRADLLGPGVLPVPKLALRRTSGDLPSRVADNLFWLGRYVERLERAARLIRTTAGRLAHAAVLSPRQAAWLRVLTVCLTESKLVPREAASPATLADALLAATRPRQAVAYGGGLPAMFSEISRLTESVRDRLTDDMYATFVQALAQARAETNAVGRRLEHLGAAMVGIQRFCTAVSGVAAENMVRGGGFLFLDLGRRLERAHAVVSEVAAALDQAPSQIEGGLSLILELCDSAITYRSRYVNAIQPAPVLDLVLVDRGNPRGLAFQLVAMHDHLDELNPAGLGREQLAATAAGLVAEIEAMVTAVLDAPDQAVAASQLPDALRALGTEIASLSNRIVRRYFALLPAVQTVGWGGDPAIRGPGPDTARPDAGLGDPPPPDSPRPGVALAGA